MIHDDDGCLIVKLNSGIYIADSFMIDDQVVKERTYSNIYLDVDNKTYRINKKFKASDVVHLKYSNPRLIELLKNVNDLNAKGWSVALNGFKSKAPKIKVNIPSQLKIKTANDQIITLNRLQKNYQKMKSKLLFPAMELIFL